MAKLISADLTNNKLCILEYTTTDGQMLSFKEDAFDAKIVSHTYTDKGRVIFAKPIAHISSNAFTNAKTLLSVIIPDSVTTIEDGQEVHEYLGYIDYWEGAFSGCSSLTHIQLSSNTISIGSGTFAYCESIKNLTIPNGVTTIGDGVFYYCSSLTTIDIPNSVEMIGERAFWDCNSLTTVTISDCVKTIRLRTFWGCHNLTSVTIGNSVTTIEYEAFYNCRSLTNVAIPDSVTAIGAGAFGCSGLKSIIIPNSVTVLGQGAFRCGFCLAEFKGKFASDDGRCLIVRGVLNSFAPETLTEYTIPDGVIEIGDCAFANCNIESITIPDSVTVIGCGAFAECLSLTKVDIPDSVTKIDDCAFSSCTSLKNITIGKCVNKVGEYAFGGTNIETIVCYPLVPPEINNSFWTFNNLIVPTGCEEVYANSDWGEYL